MSPVTNQLRTSFRNVSVKYVGPLVVYKIINPMSFLLCHEMVKMLVGLFENDRLKSAVIRASQGNVTTLPQLKQFACRYPA